MSKITQDEFVRVFESLFSIENPLTSETDLSLYIRDSIDLGELIAVLKETYGVTPQDVSLFKTNTQLADVVRIFNHEHL